MYPGERWEINYWAKAEAGFKCERCGHAEDPQVESSLQVIILDPKLPRFKWANLVVLCPGCTAFVQKTPFSYLVNQLEMFDDFEACWLQPHLQALEVPRPLPRPLLQTRR